MRSHGPWAGEAAQAFCYIVEYDTLTSEERWHEFADVILANPPFMTPKGGIRPHNRFSIQSNRSELLFLDYIAEHLTPNGRAGVIVPEGVIFQGGKAYKALRKELVEKYLSAVISLPSGVFQPYTGVKASILIFDRRRAREGREVLFSAVQDIGVSLGIKRTKTEKNDLPAILSDVSASSASELSEHSWFVDRDDIARHEWNLSAHIYRPKSQEQDVTLVSLGEVCTITKGNASSTNTEAGDYPLFVTAALPLTSSAYQFDGPHVCVPLISATGHGRASIKRIHYAEGKFALANLLAAVAPTDPDIVLPKFLHLILDSSKHDLARLMQGAANVSMNPSDLREFEIPLPTVEAQREIVAEIDGYRKVIDGAGSVIESWCPNIENDADWPIFGLADLCSIQRGKFSHRPRNEPRFYGGEFPFIQTGDIARAKGGSVSYTQTLNADGLSVSKLFHPPVVLVTIAANIGDTAGLDFPACFPDSIVALTPTENVDVRFLEFSMRARKQYLNDIAPQAAQKNINIDILKTVKISLPPLHTRRAIVAQLEAERALVNGNHRLIECMEDRIGRVIERIWGRGPAVLRECIAAE